MSPTTRARTELCPRTNALELQPTAYGETLKLWVNSRAVEVLRVRARVFGLFLPLSTSLTMSLGNPRYDWTLEEVEALFDLPFLELAHRAQEVHRACHAPPAPDLAQLSGSRTTQGHSTGRRTFLLVQGDPFYTGDEV